MTSATLHGRKISKIRHLLSGLLVLLAAYVMAMAFTANLPFGYAVGCDAFGYLRQAELIQEKGLLPGLDTALKAPEADFLRQVGLEINSNPRTWSEMIAPHCHHYRSVTDKIIMQYPPGTGMVLAVMPEQKMLQALSVLMVLSILFFFIYISLRTTDFRRLLFNVVVTAIVLAIVTRFQVVSFSVPVTVTVIAWIVWLLALPRAESLTGNCLKALSIGVLCGLLIDVRLASILLLPVVAVLFGAGKTDSRPPIRGLEIVLLACGFFVAIIPLLVANKINAGGLFITTYGEYDTSIQWRNFALIKHNLEYYFLGAQAAAALNVMTVVLIAFVGIVGGRHPSAKISEFAYWFQRDRITYTTLLGLFIVNVAFFSIKPIAMDYYLIPLLTLCSLLALAAISEVAGQNIDVPPVGYKKSLLLCVVFAGLIFGVNKIVNTPAANTELFIPKDMLREDSIVYADTSSGTLYRYKNKYASKIAFGSQCMQEQFVHHVARSGRDQYFVMDSSKMQVLVDRLGVRQFDFVGAVSSEHINFPVLHYKPNTSDDFPKITCDFNSPPALVSQLELKMNARVQANRYVGTAELVNQSEQAFSTLPNAFPIRLAWRILPTVQNALVEIWPNRIDLDLMIRPHSTSQIPIDIPLPPHSGALKLEFTLVQEGLAWFHERGMKPAVIQINAESLR